MFSYVAARFAKGSDFLIPLQSFFSSLLYDKMPLLSFVSVGVVVIESSVFSWSSNRHLSSVEKIRLRLSL